MLRGRGVRGLWIPLKGPILAANQRGSNFSHLQSSNWNPSFSRQSFRSSLLNRSMEYCTSILKGHELRIDAQMLINKKKFEEAEVYIIIIKTYYYLECVVGLLGNF